MTDPPANVVARVPLAGGARLTFRAAAPGDEAAVGRLYEGLSVPDRRARFFSSSYHFTDEVLEWWVRAGDTGGFRLLALLDDGSVVGDAGFTPLYNDRDAEFGITVAAAQRGWLGPFLLDLLVDQAARRGIRNLRAMIRRSNFPMIELVRSRGFVGLVPDNPKVLMVALGVEESVPVWPDRDRLRLLVESSSPDWPWVGAAHALGFEVFVCPMAADGPRGRCPVLRGQRCPLADGADVIVSTLPIDDAVTQRLRRAHDARRPAPLQCFAGAPSTTGAERRLDLAEDDPLTAEKVLEAVGRPVGLRSGT